MNRVIFYLKPKPEVNLVSQKIAGKCIILASMMTSLTLLSLGWTHTAITLISEFFALAFFISMIQTWMTSLLQEATPNTMKGRIFAINTLFFTIAIPLSALWIGFISDHIGFRNVFPISALAYSFISLSWLIRAGFWKVGQPQMTPSNVSIR